MARTFDGTPAEAILRLIMLGSIIAFAWSNRTSVSRYRTMPRGSQVARATERPIRRVVVLLTMLIPLSLLEGIGLDDVAGAVSILLVDCGMYLKAAMPPPDVGRRSQDLEKAHG